MGNQKITRDELLLHCANSFKRLGYHGATLETLAKACGLSKGSFYHYYSNKEMLAVDVLKWTHARIEARLFSIAYDESISPLERMERMNRKTLKLFSEEPSGCLMGIVSVDALHSVASLVPTIKAFFEAWTQALFHLLVQVHPMSQARELAEHLVADYEGAVLMDRLYSSCNSRFLRRVGERAAAALNPEALGHVVAPEFRSS